MNRQHDEMTTIKKTTNKNRNGRTQNRNGRIKTGMVELKTGMVEK